MLFPSPPPLSFPPLLVAGRGGDGSSVEGAGGATDGKDGLREVLGGGGEAGGRVGFWEEFLGGFLVGEPFGDADGSLGEAGGGLGDADGDPDVCADGLGDVDLGGLGERDWDGEADTAKPVGGLGEGFFGGASLGDAFPVGVCLGDALEEGEGEGDPLGAGADGRGSVRTRVRATASLRFVFFASTTARKENVPLAVRGALTTRRSARVDLMSPSSHRSRSALPATGRQSVGQSLHDSGF
ncbi:hypothetical protein Acsp03_60020 [Actinomadura sp. NBRC 104412]|nr:hypothetical protein Acsp03_60020 [Actinomadura sp. NBRC 104412]